MAFSFNANSVPVEQTSFTPIPAGNYNAKVTEAAMRVLKSGKGRALALTFEVIDGQFARRKIWHTLNVEHESTDTRGYAQKDLSMLMRCINVPTVEEATLHQLCNKPLKIRVVIRVVIKQDLTYGDKNEIKGFEAIGQGMQMPQAMPSMPAAPAANAAPQAPWAKAA